MKSQFPATLIVHTPSGPVPCCDSHAEQLTRLIRFIGGHINHTAAMPEDQCSNCINSYKPEVGQPDTTESEKS